MDNLELGIYLTEGDPDHMARPTTINVNKQIVIKVSKAFDEKLEYLASLYSNGNRSELIRNYLDQLYADTKAEEQALALVGEGYKPR